ncbi:MAG: proton-conducting transporter membrane subunit [Sulfolobaceae archaeon]|nr:proton-conducting transporter membrane subunit [Sulfolobaceae archaeon]
MISLFIFILSFLIASFTFLTKDRKTASTISLISLLLGVYYLFRYGLYYHIFIASSIGDFGFAVNNWNYPFIVTILLVTIVTVVYSYRYMDERFEEIGGGNWGLYYALYDYFALAMLYAVLSSNLLELYIFLEISLISSFLLILLYGYGDRRRISLLYFIWTHIGTILTLSTIVILGLETGTMNIYTTSPFILENYSTAPYALFLLIAGVVGMLFKGAAAGLNIWLPYAHGEAPTPISVLLSPNMVGLGIFTATIYFYLFHNLSFIAPIFIGWAILTMIYGGLNAIAQKDFKRFLAYSSVSQMGYMLLGSSIGFFQGLSSTLYTLPLGILASQLIYVSHGLGKAILFMSAGASITELHTRNIDDLGGLYLNSPLHTSLAFIGILNLLGLPPTIGLISEALLLFSAGQLIPKIGEGWFIVLIIFLMIAIGTSSAYATYLFKRVYSGTKNNKIEDKLLHYTVPMFILATSSIILFFIPSIISKSLLSYLHPIYGNYYIPALIVALPALGSFIAVVTPKTLHQDIRGSIVVFLIGVSMALSAINFVNSLSKGLSNLYTYAFTPTIVSGLGQYFTFSSSVVQSLLALFVSSLSFFIALYSIGYMKEDKVLRRYWGLFGFFVSSMLSVVLADNILLFIAGWEGTGLASYGLISYWLDDNEKNVVGDFGRYVLGVEYLSKPTTSGIRALVFTRIGDVGLLAGLGVLLYLDGNNMLIYSNLFPAVKALYLLPFAWLVLFVTMLGGLAKSAQFPFTQWLLTAMTGPTPVSALIHAATMVNLGAMFTFLFYPYLVYSSHQTLLFLEIVAGISFFTAIYTSLNALASNEQKQILAYSTADQISLMIFSSSIGGILASISGNMLYLYAGIAVGITQMIAHGIYKATLFMNAGSVIHYTESRYVASYPKLYRNLMIVFISQLIAALNLANFPFLIGFWAHSYIGILTSVFNPDIAILYTIAEFLGAIYIIRYLTKTFLWPKSSNEEKHEEEHGHVGPTMITSPLILSLASIILGGLIGYITAFDESLGPISSIYSVDYISLILSLIGIAIGFVVYLRGTDFGAIASLRPLINFLYYAWYVNPSFDRFAKAANGFANSLFKNFEYGVIDLTLNYKLPSTAINLGSWFYNKVQTHVLRDYLGLYVVGLLILLIIMLLLGWL